MRAALDGRTDRVKALLESGFDPNAQDDQGRTALMFAVTNRHPETTNTLLEHGADVNLNANDGSAALMLAASAGDLESVRALLSKGADVAASFFQTGKTALELAQEKGHTGIVELLLKAGAKK
jgi:ankyrin repeat protein